MKVFICDDADDSGNPIPDSGCGVIDHVLFEGYDFGDRLLEGVKFKARIDSDGHLTVEAADPEDDYWKGLNMSHWIGQALDFVRDLDVAECPKCMHEVDAQPREPR